MFVFMKLSIGNRLPSLRLVETFRKLLMTSNFDCFASLRIQCKLTYKQTSDTFQYSIISAAVEAFVLTRILFKSMKSFIILAVLRRNV